MKNHEIELAQLQEWMNEYEATYASSTHPKKRLAMTMSGSFKLYHNSEVAWQGKQPFTAVEKYNEITE